MNIILMHSLVLQRTVDFDDAESGGMDSNNAFSILRHIAKKKYFYIVDLKDIPAFPLCQLSIII